MNGKMAGNPAKQPEGCLYAAMQHKTKILTADRKSIASYTLCQDSRHFNRAGRNSAHAGFVQDFSFFFIPEKKKSGGENSGSFMVVPIFLDAGTLKNIHNV